jgi:hypothetical protein
MTRTSITIVLEIDASDDSPAGSARLPDGTSRVFRGWLGLAAAIDLLAGMSARHDASTTVNASRAPGGAIEVQKKRSSSS